MFNFFEGLKKEFKLPSELFGNYNLVLVSGSFLYVEGHKGLLKLSEENISLRVKGGVLIVLGSNLSIKELTPNTISITGKITNFEVLWWLNLKFLVAQGFLLKV